MSTPSQDLIWLPKFLRKIARVAGIDVALKLAEAHGGTRVYIPRTAAPDHWLTLLVGEAAARDISYQYGGETYIVDHHPNHGIKGMRRAAEKALDDGKSANEAARSSGLHVRSIYARKAKRREQQQPGLFDSEA